MNAIWYNWAWLDELEEVKVIKETEKMIWIDTGRKRPDRALKNGYRPYFPTKEAAIAWKRKQKELEATYSRDRLISAESDLAKFNEQYPDGVTP